MLNIDDKLIVNGTVQLSDRPGMPYLASKLECVVADIPSDNFGTAICLHTGVDDLDSLRPWIAPEDIIQEGPTTSDGKILVAVAPRLGGPRGEREL